MSNLPAVKEKDDPWIPATEIKEGEARVRPWMPNPGPQARAWAAYDVDFLLYAGGRGSGKTSWLLGSYGLQARRIGKSARGLILRQSFPELAELITQATEMFVYTGLATYNDSKHVFSFRGVMAGATLELGYLEKPKDYGRYHGRAFTYIGFDELPEFKDWEMIRKMGSCCRSRDPKAHPIMRATGNPGGILHNEVKEFFVDPAPEGDTLIKSYSVDPKTNERKVQTRMYIFSTVENNPYLFKNDPNYLAWLNSLTGDLRRAWREGCWDVALGAMFADLFRHGTHVKDTITPADIPKSFPKYRAYDHGSAAPFCVLWYFISNGDPLIDGRVFPKGSIVFYREYYGADPENRNKGIYLTSLQIAKNIRKIEEVAGEWGMIKPGPADTSIWSQNDGRTAIYDGFESEEIYFTKANKKSCVEGWEQIRLRLKGDDKPSIYFTHDCPNTTRTLPALARSIKDPEDIEPHQEDHPCDVVAYVCKDHPVPTERKEVKRQRKIASRSNHGPVTSLH